MTVEEIRKKIREQNLSVGSGNTPQSQSFAQQVEQRADEIQTLNKSGFWNTAGYMAEGGAFGVADFGLNTTRATASNVQNNLIKGERKGEKRVLENIKNLLSDPMKTTRDISARLLEATENIANIMDNENTSKLYKTSNVVREIINLPTEVARETLIPQLAGGAIQYVGAKNDTLDERVDGFLNKINLAQDYLDEKFEEDSEGRSNWAKTLGRGARSATNSATSAILGKVTGSPLLRFRSNGLEC